MRKRDHLAPDDAIVDLAGFRDFDHPFERDDRIARRAEIERDQIGLTVGQHRHRRRRAVEMIAVIELGQQRLHRAVAAIDDQHLRPDAGEGLQRRFDLVDAFDFVMKQLGMRGAEAADTRQLRAITRRAWIGQQRDPDHPCHFSAVATGLTLAPWT